VVTVEGDQPLALHADGEWLGRWPSVRFQIIPGSLDVIVPRVGTTGGERRP
jgi:diacylglycerol kinase family enzyme